MSPMSSSVLHIDVGAIARNTRLLKEQLLQTRLVCVVKADAYNHGADQVVPVMDEAGADAFGVATFDEAKQVRALTEKPVLAWLWEPGEDIPEGVELGVPGLEHLEWLIGHNVRAPLHIVVDTGMNRSGIDEEDWARAFIQAREAGLNVVGLMSHLACADEPGHPHNVEQHAAFIRAVTQAEAEGLNVTQSHLANSPGTFTSADLAFNQVRAGIALYGLNPVAPGHNGSTLIDATALTPAMTWSARLTAVKRIKRGEGASYGLTWTAPADGWTAVVPVGYADGLQRSWQGAVEVAVGDTRYPQVGRVCMDQIIIWLGDNPENVAVGDEAVIFGDGGMSAAELAERAGTIHYEVVCAPHGRVRRVYGGRGDVDKQKGGKGEVL